MGGWVARHLYGAPQPQQKRAATPQNTAASFRLGGLLGDGEV